MSKKKQPTQLGFKVVTPENLLETDPVVKIHVMFNAMTGEVHPHRPEEWTARVMAVGLDGHVPLEVRRTFVLAQGALCYAHWYYPMLTLITHEMYRIADFATSVACRERKLKAKTFQKRIDELVASEVIPADSKPLWTNIRRARNRATHPISQNIYGFDMAHHTLLIVQELITGIAWLAETT